MAGEWAQSVTNGDLRNIAKDMSRLTLEIAGKCLFSNDFEGYRNDIIEWSEFINEYSGMTPYPIVRSPWFPSPANFKMKRVLRDFHKFVGDLYDERVRADTQRADLFSLLLGARHEEVEGGMNREELTDEVVTMIFGGHETSATALTWAWFFLAQNPEVEARLHEELDTLLDGRDPKPEDVSKLKYTRMVIDEAMRMGPPFWFENRNAIEEDELWGEKIPKGSMIMFSRHAMHMHPEFWDTPTEFKPERFASSASKDRTKFAYIPFGGGPRICAGITFATIELVIALATLANRYSIELDASASMEVDARLTMTPRGGVPARIVLRKR
jgi:cytochrome P450